MRPNDMENRILWDELLWLGLVFAGFPFTLNRLGIYAAWHGRRGHLSGVIEVCLRYADVGFPSCYTTVG
jgi:hypothetical protein